MEEVLMDLPSLRGSSLISVDTETNDPGLIEHGPGSIRGEGYLVGFSVSTPEGFSRYFPIRHESGNVENPDAVLAWAEEELSGPEIKLGVNILYDMEWLNTEGIRLGGLKYDVQTAEPLLDENRGTYKLESLAQSYLGEGKEERGLINSALLRGIPPDKIKENIWKLPGNEVAGYAIKDSILPIKIFDKQKELLKKEELWNIFEMETELIDLLLEMRLKGVPVDLEKAAKVKRELEKRQNETLAEIRMITGADLDIWSNEQVAACCRGLGLAFPTTEKESPSFLSGWLDDQDIPFFKKLRRARQLDRAGAVFVQAKIIDVAVNGRIYPQFFATRRDDYGTRSGRLSSANPNLQQVPARNEELAPLIRSLFVAEKGGRWGKLDVSQQEFRILVHYAALLGLPGAEKAAEIYRSNPAADFHQMVADMAAIERKPAKTINLGLSYGMGPKKLAEKLGLSYDEARALIDKYHAGLPFIRPLMSQVSRVADKRGYVKTLLGRRRRFDLWGPPNYEKGKTAPLYYDQAVEKYGKNVVRYFTYRAWNAVDQGGAADMMKASMVACWRAGLVPSVTVHDELDFADADDRTMKTAHEAMRDSIKLLVPMKVDCSVGPSWGEQKEWKP